MQTSPEFWHARFLQQSGWTLSIRNYIVSRLSLSPADKILEVGCGTGAVLDSLAATHPGDFYGIDLNRNFLQSNPVLPSTAPRIQGDGLRLPFSASRFAVTFCHYLLLWLADPLRALDEMARVTQPGGWVVAFAEPDYGGRIDYPKALGHTGELQAAALLRQGADPAIGRKLPQLFHTAGLESIEAGILGSQWQPAELQQGFDLEWQVMVSDLSGELSQAALDELYEQELQARSRGARVLFVPTFYALGKKPQ